MLQYFWFPVLLFYKFSNSCRPEITWWMLFLTREEKHTVQNLPYNHGYLTKNLAFLLYIQFEISIWLTDNLYICGGLTIRKMWLKCIRYILSVQYVNFVKILTFEGNTTLRSRQKYTNNSQYYLTTITINISEHQTGRTCHSYFSSQSFMFSCNILPEKETDREKESTQHSYFNFR